MKTITILLITLCSIVSYSQSENEGDIIIRKTQLDDVYRAGESIKVNAMVQGDLVIAGGKLVVNDSINGDLTAAGGELFLNDYIKDDVRMAVGRAVIDSEVGDDLVVFGGEVILTKNAKIQGDLICIAGNIQINGEVVGKLDVKGADILINGKVNGASKLIGQDIILGPNAQFYKDVEYWSDNDEIDFGTSLINAKAQFNEILSKEESQLSLATFGTVSLALWLFYVLSAFLVILALHALFRNAFSKAAEGLEDNLLKSFGFGLIYLFGIPLLILFAFLMIIGIPLGLFATGVFVISLLIGHLVAALFIAYYWKNKRDKNWGFWSITFIALLCAIVLRLLTIIPFVGVLISVVVLSITYGSLTLKLFHTKKQLVKK